MANPVIPILFTFLLLSTTAHAGTAVTLKEAVDLALKNNHLLKGAARERDAAVHGVKISGSRYLPRVFLEESLTASNAPPRVFMMKLDEGRFAAQDFAIGNLNHPSSHTDFRTSLSLELPLLDFSIGRGMELAENEVEAKDHSLLRRRENVGFGVFTAFLDAQRAQSAVETAEKAVADAREHFRLAKVRNEAGVGLRSDELRARTALSEMEQRQITAINNLRLAGMRLSLAVGGDPRDALEVAEKIGSRGINLSPDDIVALALSNRHDLKERMAEAAKGAIGERLADSSWLPTLYGGATYQMNDREIPFGRDNDSWVAGLTLRWELFDGMRRNADQARARAGKESAAAYLEQARNEIAYQVRESILRREETGKRLEVARHALLDAEEGVRLIATRFENSLTNMVDLLDAQSALNRARTELVDTEAEYALAEARIYHAAGVFLKEVIQ